jgi:predicted TIM-barrel fold metal-dependent hydrolase
LCDNQNKTWERYPDYFIGAAETPFLSWKEAVDELGRAKNELGMKGM